MLSLRRTVELLLVLWSLAAARDLNNDDLFDDLNILRRRRSPMEPMTGVKPLSPKPAPPLQHVPTGKLVPLQPTPLNETELALIATQLAVNEFELPPSEWHALKPGARAVAVAQYMADFDLERRCVPLLEWETENFYMHGEPVTITLGGLIAKHAKSTIHEVKWGTGSDSGDDTHDFPPSVIKYEVAASAKAVHALVQEWGFYRHLDGSGLTPRAFFLSAPTPVTAVRTPKTDFGKPIPVKDLPRHIRYFVMERISTDLFGYIKQQRPPQELPPTEALDVTIQTLRVLQQLHARNVVHGDLHLGNVIAFETEPKLRIGVLDFGLSMFASDAALLPDRIRSHLAMSDWKHTVWKMEGFRTAPRDDVFMALINLGVLLDSRFRQALVHPPGTTAKDIYEYWKYGDMFCVPTGCGWMLQLSRRARQQVRTRMLRFQSTIRALELKGEIPYDELVAQLEEVVAIITQDDDDEETTTSGGSTDNEDDEGAIDYFFSMHNDTDYYNVAVNFRGDIHM